MKEITELIQEREGAYTDYQDASALKYSHVQATARSEFSLKISFIHTVFSYTLFILFFRNMSKKDKEKNGGIFSMFGF